MATRKYEYKGIFARTGRDDQGGLRRLVDRLVREEQEENPEAAAEQEARETVRRLFHPHADDEEHDDQGGTPA